MAYGRETKFVLTVAGAALLLSSGAFEHLFDLIHQGGVNNPLAQLLWFPLYALVLLWIGQAHRATHALLQDHTVLVVLSLVALCVLSSMWSLDPMITMKRSMGLAFSTLLALYLSQSLTLAQWRYLWMILGIVIAVAILFAVVLMPQYGIHHDMNEGAWRGFFLHKNQMGAVCVFMALLMLFMMWSQFEGTSTYTRFMAGALLLVYFVLILMTDFSTALVAFLGSLAILLLLRSVLQFNVASVPLIVMALGLLVILVRAGINEWFLGSIIENVGKGDVLTGRAAFWKELWFILMDERPFLGYGYQSFWDSYKGSQGVIWSFGSWIPPHAHNGLLQVAVDIGLIGMGLLLVLWFMLLKDCMKLATVRTLGSYRLLPFAMLTLVTILNISETSILKYNNFIWMMLLIVVFTVKRAATSENVIPKERAAASPRQS